MSQENHGTMPLPKIPHFDDESKEEKLDIIEAETYRSLIGYLRYLSNIILLDIPFATVRLARNESNQTTAHANMAQHILRYLKNMTNHGIIYTVADKETLNTYCDAYFANSTGRRSINGTIHTAFGSPVQWASNKQATISISTCEAEYVAASHALQETLWLRRLMDQICTTSGQKTTKLPPTTIATDSLSAIKVANHEGKTKRRKHIDVKHYHLTHHIDEEKIKLEHMKGELNPADSMTKPLGPQAFTKHMTQMIKPLT